MLAKANELGETWTLELVQSDAGVWDLTAMFPGYTIEFQSQNAEIPQINWELDFNQQEKPLLNSELGTIPVLSNPVRQRIKEAIKEQNDQVLKRYLIESVVSGSITNAEQDAALVAYHHMQYGMDKIPVLSAVLTRTAVASSIWQVPWTNASVSTPVIISTSTLISQEDVTENLHLRMPTDNYQNVHSATSIPLQYGWLVGPIKKNSSNAGRYIYQQSWKYNLWPTTYFGQPK